MALNIPIRRHWRNFDWLLLLGTTALIVIGLLAIQSATHSDKHSSDLQRQLLLLIVATVGFIGLIVFDYRRLLGLSPYIYWSTNALLAYVLLRGHSALGAQRWLSVGGFTIQPSELAKLSLIITMAAMLTRWRLDQAKSYLAVGFHVLVPALLIFRQPDLGTSLVFAAITVGMLFGADAQPFILFLLLSPLASIAAYVLGGPVWLLYLVAVGTALFLILGRKRWPQALVGLGVNVGAGLLAPVAWNMLKEYQQKRLTIFLNPESDPLGSGYHILQSKIAIGSGGIWGKGLFHGSQTQLNFIPEQHTDFIFSVIGEELGLVGGLVLLSLYLLLIWRGLYIAARARDRFGSLIAIGIVSMLLFHVFINIGMSTGMMPVTGIPLPFISYGGTSLLTNLMAMGLLENISLTRLKHIIKET